MSDSIGESWDARIRERARRNAASSGHDALQNWVNAKEELWHETLAEHRPLALKLNWMRENLDEGTEEGLRAAASAGCEILRILVGSDSITGELKRRAGQGSAQVSRTDISDYLRDDDLVDDFLAVERSLLIKTGLEPPLAAELCSLIMRFHLDGASYTTLPPNIMQLLNKAVDKVCLPYEQALEAPPPVSMAVIPASKHTILRKTLRVAWVIGAGGLIVGVNLTALHLVGDITGEVSKIVGGTMFEQGIKSLVGA